MLCKMRFEPEEDLEIHVNYFLSSAILLFYTLPFASGTATGRVLVNIHPRRITLEYDVCFTVFVEFVHTYYVMQFQQIQA